MRRHRFDPISFVGGIVFTAVGLLFLLPERPVGIIDLAVRAGRWALPTLLLVSGIAVLMSALTRGERDDDSDQAS